MTTAKPHSPRLRIVEIAQGIAGPALGRIYAALGHDVIKCEPPKGDFARAHVPTDDQGRGFGFAARNAGKSSVVIDLDIEAGRQSLAALLDTSDVLITDLAHNDAQRLGLDPAELKRRWPALIVVSFTLYGATSERIGGENCLLAEAYGGLTTMIGEPMEKPLSLGGSQSAFAAAYSGWLGTSIALLNRNHRGCGDFIDIALCDVAAYIDWKSDVAFFSTGRTPHRIGASADRWRMIRASDGWVGVIYQSHQWPALVSLIGDLALNSEHLAKEAYRKQHPEEWWPLIERWAAQHPKIEIYERAQKLGLPFGFCADARDLFESQQLTERGFIMPRPVDSDWAKSPILGPLFRSAAISWINGTPPQLGEHNHRLAELTNAAPVAKGKRNSKPLDAPLAGKLVLDFGTITAGAATSRLLADYGATVIKIEAPDRPDSFRRWTLAVENSSASAQSPLFESNNAGKLGVTLDLKTAEGAASLRKLAEKADIVVENFRVGVTERLGIDYESIRKINPRILYLSLSSQGQDGPEARRSSYGSTLDLLSGLASVTGYSSERPLWSSSEVNFPDQIVAVIGAALVSYCVSMGIKGTQLDVSQREVTAWAFADAIADYAANGIVAGPTGNRRTGFAPNDIYPCRYGDWFAISCATDAQREALAQLIGWTTVEAYTADCWIQHADEADRQIERWTSGFTQDELDDYLSSAGIPGAPVQTARQRTQQPRFTARQVFLPTELRLKGYPILLAGYTPPLPKPAPGLGEHNAELL
ncbi:CoA transferase [Tardiphaga sp. 619_E2_N8_5]|uniref:CaiB/BaiF CoA-transferase family protein n=1 Tax=unclassified Tardiphaga TaxID=2631404 RepID=UPI003F1E53EA